ncbi:MAG: SH3 domain-containing protein [Eubacteriales bacterium]|nr:SH3 domain-containing protein [Eubacteriales bacterium]
MMNKFMRKMAVALTLTAAVTGISTTAFAKPCNKQAYVTASNLAVRTAPTVNAQQVYTLKHGEGVVVVDTDDYDGWTKVGLNGKELYVCSKYISEYNEGQTYTGERDDHGFKADSNVATKDYYTVSVAPGTYLALRNDFTSDEASEIDQLYNGTRVLVIEGSGKFWTVEANGRVGYVNSNYLV